MADIERSLARAASRLRRLAIPAAPTRRLDAGAVGSLAVGYPLQLCDPHDPRLLDLTAWLMEKSFLRDGFFQDMIHSGTNPYLTLHVAQVLLRAGDARCLALMRRVAELASPTGQWPEAIHPHTGGGCMGDGQHVWAAAEWVLMLRNCLLREEGETLVLLQGLPPEWLQGDAPVEFGPAPTSFGTLTLRIDCAARPPRLHLTALWHAAPRRLELRLPGRPARTLGVDETEIALEQT